MSKLKLTDVLSGLSSVSGLVPGLGAPISAGLGGVSALIDTLSQPKVDPAIPVRRNTFRFNNGGIVPPKINNTINLPPRNPITPLPEITRNETDILDLPLDEFIQVIKAKNLARQAKFKEVNRQADEVISNIRKFNDGGTIPDTVEFVRSLADMTPTQASQAFRDFESKGGKLFPELHLKDEKIVDNNPVEIRSKAVEKVSETGAIVKGKKGADKNTAKINGKDVKLSKGEVLRKKQDSEEVQVFSNLFTKEGIPLSKLEFERQKIKNELEKTLELFPDDPTARATLEQLDSLSERDFAAQEAAKDVPLLDSLFEPNSSNLRLNEFPLTKFDRDSTSIAEDANPDLSPIENKIIGDRFTSKFQNNFNTGGSINPEEDLRQLTLQRLQEALRGSLSPISTQPLDLLNFIGTPQQSIVGDDTRLTNNNLLEAPLTNFTPQVLPQSIDPIANIAKSNQGLPELESQIDPDTAAFAATDADGETKRGFLDGISTGDKVFLGAKAAELIGKGIIAGQKPEQEQALTDNTQFSRINFDPANALQQISLAENTARRALSDRAGSFSQVAGNVQQLATNSQRNRANTVERFRNLQQQENNRIAQLKSNQRRFNIGQADRTNVINAQNRAQAQNNLDALFTSIGNAGTSVERILNQRDRDKISIEALRLIFPDVADNLLKTLIK